MGEGFKVQRQLYEAPAAVVYLYNEGDEYIPLTGGWRIGFANLSGTQSKNTDHLYMSTTSSNAAYRTYVTTNKVDFTGFAKLKMEYELQNNGYIYALTLGATTNSNGASDLVVETNVSTSTVEKTTLEVDISSVSGSYYVGVPTRGSQSASKIYKVWLE